MPVGFKKQQKLLNFMVDSYARNMLVMQGICKCPHSNHVHNTAVCAKIHLTVGKKQTNISGAATISCITKNMSP